MTRGSIRGYIEASQGRHFGALKKERSKILDEFTKVILASQEHNVEVEYKGLIVKALHDWTGF